MTIRLFPEKETHLARNISLAAGPVTLMAKDLVHYGVFYKRHPDVDKDFMIPANGEPPAKADRFKAPFKDA